MTITVHCPECSKAFPVDPAKIPEGGVKVRCSACSAIFRVEEPEEPAPEPATEVEPSAESDPEGAARTAHGAVGEAEQESEVTPEPEDDSGAETAAEEALDSRAEATVEPDAEADSWDATGGFDAPEATPEAESGVDAAETDDGDDAWWSPGGEDAGGDVDTADREEAGASADVDSPDDWVIETEPDVDPSSLDVEPMETVESSQAGEVDSAPTEGLEGAMPLPPLESDDDAGDDEEPASPPQAGGLGMGAPPSGSVVAEPGQEEELTGEAEPDEGMAPESVPAPESSPSGFQFGKRDPEEKARRLARVLVSDMIMYNPERHSRALEAGTLKQDFEEEIQKSWEEYVEQVGEEMAHQDDYLSQALNEILAKGEPLFQGSPPS